MLSLSLMPIKYYRLSDNIKVSMKTLEACPRHARRRCDRRPRGAQPHEPARGTTYDLGWQRYDVVLLWPYNTAYTPLSLIIGLYGPARADLVYNPAKIDVPHTVHVPVETCTAS